MIHFVFCFEWSKFYGCYIRVLDARSVSVTPALFRTYCSCVASQATSCAQALPATVLETDRQCACAPAMNGDCLLSAHMLSWGRLERSLGCPLRFLLLFHGGLYRGFQIILNEAVLHRQLSMNSRFQKKQLFVSEPGGYFCFLGITCV